MTPSRRRERTRLLVVSHVVHHEVGGQVAAYTPYVAEIDEWAGRFAEVVVVCPVSTSRWPDDCSAFTASNVSLSAVTETGGPGLVAKLRQVLLVPVLCFQILRQMRTADVIHVRCPGNLGLLGVALAPLVRKPRIAKYAGQWDDYTGEAWSYRLQRFLLGSRWWGAPVTVYGKHPEDRPHVVDFFSSAVTAEQAERGERAARSRQRTAGRLDVLFVGRLSRAKHAEVVVEAVAELRDDGVDVRARIIGDGPERDPLVFLARKRGVSDLVDLPGALPLDDVLAAYEQSDVLVLASETEGFPKAAIEAMGFGLVVIGSDIGRLRAFLADGRGHLVPPGSVGAVTAALRRIAADPESADRAGVAAAAFARDYTLDALGDGIEKILDEWWPPDRSGDGSVSVARSRTRSAR